MTTGDYFPHEYDRASAERNAAQPAAPAPTPASEEAADYQPVPTALPEYDEAPAVPVASELSDAPVMARMAEAPARPSVLAVSTEERLLIENLHLRAIICAQKRTQLLQAVMQCEQELVEWQTKIEASRNQLGEKYNIDFTRFEVREGDGVIVPRGHT